MPPVPFRGPAKQVAAPLAVKARFLIEAGKEYASVSPGLASHLGRAALTVSGLVFLHTATSVDQSLAMHSLSYVFATCNITFRKFGCGCSVLRGSQSHYQKGPCRASVQSVGALRKLILNTGMEWLLGTWSITCCNA